MCRSCDISHRVEEPPITQPPTTTIATEAVVSQESLAELRAEQHPASYIRVRPGIHQSQHEQPHQSSTRLFKRGTDDKAGECNRGYIY